MPRDERGHEERRDGRSSRSGHYDDRRDYDRRDRPRRDERDARDRYEPRSRDSRSGRDRYEPRGGRDAPSSASYVVPGVYEELKDAPVQRAPSPPSTATEDPAPPMKKQRTEPLSLEELAAKKHSAEEAKKKPVFLTAKQREARALEKRQQEVQAQQAQRAQDRQDRLRFLQEAQTSAQQRAPPRQERPDRNDRWTRRPERSNGGRKREPAGAAPEVTEKETHSGREGIPLPGRDEKEAARELEEIKKQYLGLTEKRQRVVRPSEKYARVLDWDLSEDTSRDFNDIYAKRARYQPGFGTGFMAGIDKQEQIAEYRKQLSTEKKKKFDKKLAGDGEDRHSLSRKHWSEKSLKEMTERDWRIFREDFNISARGKGMQRPLRNWRESTMPGELLDAVEAVGYKEPTPIQRQAIPIALSGRDILGVAQTGSGKTAAFLLPMLVYLSKMPPMDAQRKVDGPYALILAPVRELVQQIEKECQKFARFTNIRTVSIVGGQSIEQQGMALEQGCEVVIATPGRMIDCLRSRYAVLNQCNYVVLDEADKMINMGFLEQVQQVMESMPAGMMKSDNDLVAEQQEAAKDRVFRTTIMYSATMPPEIETLARTFLRRPAYISIGEVGKAVDKIKQRVLFVKGEADKKNKLLDVIQQGPKPPIIVFANQKKVCDLIAKHLNQSGFSATVLHSSKTQENREYSLEAFKTGQFDILVATDVAGRGLDIQGVTHVINYDLPTVQEHYVHRIGRTGRAGLDGLATSFMTNDDTGMMWFLKTTLTKAGHPIPPELARHEAAQFNPELADKLGAAIQ